MTTEIKQDTLDLAKKLRAKITIGDNGVATIKEGTYVELLPEGITEETVKALQAHNSHLVSAGALALGEEAVPYLKKHKAVERIELSIPAIGKDTIDFTFDRSKVVTNPSTKETSTTYGAVNVKLNSYSTRPRGELAKVKGHLAEIAMKALGDK